MDHKIMEDNLRKIESVVSSKIVLGENEQIDEIHVVSNGHRGPKQIVRDVQSVLLATYDVDIDHKKISIAQIPEDSVQRSTCRVKISGVSQEVSGTKATIRVNILKNEDEYVHSRSGVNTSRNVDRMLVESTLSAIQEACGYDEVFIFEDIRQVSISGATVIVVCVSGLLGEYELKLSGSCIVKNDYHGAIVKATLDAVNRYVTKW
ncbi:MAG: hypothetical protein RBT15_06035 [Gudongella sp.]|nr:hypothetical protein [Gudongella sp.]